MNGLPYYKRYPRDFIEGTIGMSFELKTTYSFILDLIYMQAGKLPDDSRYISGLLNCSVKKWNLLRNQLIELGKIEVSGEFLTNYRALSEVKRSAKYQQKQAEKGRTTKKNNDLRKTTAAPSRDLEPDTNTDITNVISIMSETEVSNASKKNNYSEEFEAFWKAYPTGKTMSKKSAFGQWKRLDKESRQLATNSLPAFRAEVAKQDHTTLHAERYLSKRVFDNFEESSEQSEKARKADEEIAAQLGITVEELR